MGSSTSFSAMSLNTSLLIDITSSQTVISFVTSLDLFTYLSIHPTNIGEVRAAYLTQC